MRILTILALPFILAFASCDSGTRKEQTERVLFVGNSLTYVGNTPAIYSALTAANGHRVISDMIVGGGATLSERVADGTVANALASKSTRHSCCKSAAGI